MVRSFPLFLKALSLVMLTVVFAVAVNAQKNNVLKPTPPKPQPTPVTAKNPQKPATAEQVAETAIFFYSGGRGTLDLIRKTTSEHGRTTVTTAGGNAEQFAYHRWVLRGETLGKQKVRLDQTLPNTTFSLIYSGERTFGIFNNSIFPPSDSARKDFENQIFHGIDALLRYKADESKLDLAPNQKLYGVDFYIVDLTDKQGRQTRYYVSAKTYRVMMLTYEDAGVKYRRKFYDYNYAQGTLVPFRTVLWADEKQVEESEVGSITFGQKVDENLFAAG